MQKIKIINDKMNKKGISEVIATVITILISLVAISLVWVVVNSIINEPALAPKFDCLDIQINTPIKIEYACYNLETEEFEVTLGRSLDNYYFEDIEFIIGGEEWFCSDNCGNCVILKPNSKKTYFFSTTSAENWEFKEAILKINDCILNATMVVKC